MTKPTYVSDQGAGRFDAGSAEARAAELMQQWPLEELEELAVVVTDEAQRADLEDAVRRGREMRGGTSDSGGAVREEADDVPRHGGRIVLDPSAQFPPLGMVAPAPEAPPEPTARKRRWGFARWRR